MTGLAPRAAAVHRAVLASLRELPERYLPEHAPPGDRRYRLEIAGCPPHIVMVRGHRCQVRPATDGRVDATIVIDAEAWLDLVEGRAGGLEAFLTGRVQIRGDLNEALRLDTLFAVPQGSTRARQPARIARHHVDGVTIETYEAGPLDGQPVLMLHGLGASKVSLLPAIAGLARRFRVIAMDFPGFGKSDTPRSSYELARLAAWASGTLESAGVGRAAVVGNSLGGRVAVELALREPACVSGIGLLCPAVAFDEYAFVRPALGAVRADVAVGLPLWPLPRGVVDTGLRLLFADPTRVPADNLRAARDDFLRSLRSRRRRMALAAVGRQLALEAPERFWTRLEGLAVPSLWIFGDSDRLVAPAYAEAVRRAVPDAVVEVWSSCGHVPQFEHPDRTIAVLTRHLATFD